MVGVFEVFVTIAGVGALCLVVLVLALATAIYAATRTGDDDEYGEDGDVEDE